MGESEGRRKRERKREWEARGEERRGGGWEAGVPYYRMSVCTYVCTECMYRYARAGARARFPLLMERISFSCRMNHDSFFIHQSSGDGKIYPDLPGSLAARLTSSLLQCPSTTVHWAPSLVSRRPGICCSDRYSQQLGDTNKIGRAHV